MNLKGRNNQQYETNKLNIVIHIYKIIIHYNTLPPITMTSSNLMNIPTPPPRTITQRNITPFSPSILFNPLYTGRYNGGLNGMPTTFFSTGSKNSVIGKNVSPSILYIHFRLKLRVSAMVLYANVSIEKLFPLVFLI